MEAMDVTEAIEQLRQKIATKSTGPKKQENGYEFYTPHYPPSVAVERQKDLSQYGIKGRYLDMTFSKLKQLGAPPEDKDVYNYAMKYAVHLNEHIKSGKGLIMMGPVGTGKTSLAISILRRAIEQGYNGYLISMMSLLDTLLVLSKGPAEHYLKFENRIRNCPLLVLDDLGAEYDNKWVSSKVDSIISDRVERGKATIITTNLSVQQIKKCYDSRIYDRLKETSFILSFKGKSKRDPLDISQI